MAIFADQSREALRRSYLDAWTKFQRGTPLTALEAQLAAVISEHPEYHEWLQRGDSALHEEFTPERGRENPFLHLGMHLAIREQVATNRPAGIADIHARLARNLGDPHRAEHAMIEPLGVALWSAQRNGQPPDETAYLEALRRLR